MTNNKAWLDDLPPVLRIVLENSVASNNLSDLHKNLKSLLPDLRKQALWSVENQDRVYLEHQKEFHKGFLINPASGLDPFSRHGKCLDFQCRIKTAEEIARTVGLYADRAVIGDPFSDHVLLSERWSKNDTITFFTNLSIFTRLAPLFRAGVFRFSNNFSFLCKAHLSEFQHFVQNVTDQIDDELWPSIHVEKSENRLILHTDGILGTPYLHGIPRSAKGRLELRQEDVSEIAHDLFKDTLQQEIHETLFNMRRSAHLSAITFSNSRVSLIAARRIETKQTIAKEDLEVWEASRSAQFPWIGRLTPEQVVTLRDRAHQALPRFRARIAMSLSEASDTDVAKLVAQMREEALEVQAELNAIDQVEEGRFRTASSALAMTVSVYGFVGEFIPAGAAVTGLLSLLGLLHANQHKEQQEVSRLTSKPSYVLVQAKQLAEHAEPA